MQKLTRWIAALSLALVGCQAPGQPLAQTHTEPVMTIDMVQAVEALATRPNSLWQDALFNTPAVQARREAARYAVQTVSAGNAWSGAAANLPSTSTNGVAYAHYRPLYGNRPPQPGDLVYAVCDNGVVVRRDPTNAGAPVTPNFNALTGIGGASITRTALMLSGDNSRIYLLTTNGYFIILNAATGARISAFRLSMSGFTNIAPFIDYSNGGGAGYSDEHVYALSADGSLYRVRVLGGNGVQITGWRSVNGTDKNLGNNTVTVVAGNLVNPAGTLISNALDYGAAVTIKASPIVWGGEAYFGASDGKLYRVRTSSGTLQSLKVSTFPIETTPAIEFDNAMRVRDVFIPGGDRLHWVDASNPGGLSRKAISPPLVLDKKPKATAPVVPASGVLNAYPYATTGLTTYAFSANEWVGASTGGVAAGQGPTRWGNGAPDLGAINLGARAQAIVRSPADGTIWVTSNDSQVRQIDPTTGTVLETFDGNGNYARLVKTIPVGVSPAGLTPDPINGGVWVSCYGSDDIRLLDPSGTSVSRVISNIPKPTGIWYDDNRTPGNASDDRIWVCSTTGPLKGPATGKLYRVNVSDGSLASYDNTNTRSHITDSTKRAKNWNSFGGNPANNTDLLPGAWALLGPQGVCVDAQGKVWVANTAENLAITTPAQSSGNTPNYPFDLDGTGSNANHNGVQNDRSSIMIFDPNSNGGEFTDRIVCTGAPYGMDVATVGGVDSIWIGTYRWGQDVVERYGIVRNTTTPANSFQRLFRSNQTSNHWQPRWVAVDNVRDRVWVVNGNSSWPAATAVNGLDVIKASSTGSANMPTTNTATAGTYATGGQPRGVDTDSAGNVWVANSISKTCTKYSATGQPLGNYPVGNRPYAVACDKNDITWVANLDDGTVSRLEPNTKPPATLDKPTGLAVDLAGNVYIANGGDGTLTILDSNGDPLSTKLTLTASPTNIALGAGGTIFVSSTGSNTITRMGNLLGTPVINSANGSGNAFWTVTDAAGRSFTTNPANTNRIVRTDANGGNVTTFNPGNNDPRGLAVNPANSDVWVALRTANAVVRLPAGNSLGTPNFAVGTQPQGVAVENTQVWAANTGANSITRLNALQVGARAALGTSLGTITGYNGAGSPIHMAIDGQENLWVTNTTTNLLTKIWFAGAQDLMAGEHYRGTDGNKSYGYLHFPINAGNFNGFTPRAARLRLKALTNSALTSETINAYRAADAVAGSAWGGFPGTPSVGPGSAPTLGSLEGSSAPTAISAGTTVDVPLRMVSDLIDVSNTPYDAANGLMSYAFTSAGANLADVAHWSTAAGARPELRVDVLPTALPAGVGLRSQPTIDSGRKRIFVMGTNAVFELPFDTPANFGDPSKIAYSFTGAGIGYGPVNGTRYVAPLGACTLTAGGRLITQDFDPNANTTTFNSFKLGPAVGGFYLDTSGNNAAQLLTTSSIGGPVSNQQITYDYDLGSVYVASGSTLYAIKLLP